MAATSLSAALLPTVGERVRLRKAHPCGGREWVVTRIGADIGLQCQTCARRVFLPADEFARRCSVRNLPAPPLPDTEKSHAEAS